MHKKIHETKNITIIDYSKNTNIYWVKLATTLKTNVIT